MGKYAKKNVSLQRILGQTTLTDINKPSIRMAKGLDGQRTYKFDDLTMIADGKESNRENGRIRRGNQIDQTGYAPLLHKEKEIKNI